MTRQDKRGSQDVSLTMGDLHCIQAYLEQHSAALMADGKNLNCICLD